MDCQVLKFSFWILMLTGACTSKKTTVTVTRCQGGVCGKRTISMTCQGNHKIHLKEMYFSNDHSPNKPFSKNEASTVCQLCSNRRTCQITVAFWHYYSKCTVGYSCRGQSNPADDICNRRLMSSTAVTHMPTTTSTPSTSTPSTSTPSTPTPSTPTPSTSTLSSTTTMPSTQTTVATRPASIFYTPKAPSLQSTMSSRQTKVKDVRTSSAQFTSGPTTAVSTIKGSHPSTNHITTQELNSESSSTAEVTTGAARSNADQESAIEGGDRTGKLSTVGLVGIAAGALVLLISVVAGVCLVKRRLNPPKKRKPARSAQNPGYESNHVNSPSSAQKGVACDDIAIQEEAYAVITDNDGGDQTQKPRHLNDYENTKTCDYDRIRFRDNGVRFIVDPGYGTLEHVGQEDVDSSYSHINLSGKNPQTPQSDLYSHLQNSGSHGNKMYPDADGEDLYNHCNDTRTRLAVDPDIDCYSHLSSSTREPDP